MIYGEVQHLQQLVEDLRTLSLADAGELRLNRQPIEPRALLAEVAALFQHRAVQQQITLVVDATDTLPAINIDEGRLVQVLGNLVANTLRYTPEGGHITLGAVERSGGVQLIVQDDGAGIPSEALPHIFDRFYRADQARHQDSNESGLGLAIARSIVEAHGGTITAESELGKGTTFTIRLA
jgi:two-component system sensor histidine kinase BaeS